MCVHRKPEASLCCCLHVSDAPAEDPSWLKGLSIHDFFTLVKAKQGNNTVQCHGACGGLVGSQGKVFDGGPQRMMAHLLGIPNYKITSCNRLPAEVTVKQTGETHSITRAQLIRVVRAMWDTSKSSNSSQSRKRDSNELGMEPGRVQNQNNQVAASAATAGGGGQQQLSIMNSMSSGTKRLSMTSKRYTTDEVRDGWARCFIMTGSPYSLYSDKYFRAAIKMTINALEPENMLCKPETLSDVNALNVHSSVETRVDAYMKSELAKYGGCMMSDGAKGTASIPFVNFLAGLPAGVFFLNAQDTNDWPGHKKTMLQLTLEHKKLMEEVTDKYSIEKVGTFDFVVADGACSSMEIHLKEMMPWATFGLCLPHSIDRIFYDIFKLDWAMSLKTKTHTILDFIMHHGQPLKMYKRAAREHQPTQQTAHLLVDSRAPSMPARSAETRMASEYYSMASVVKLKETFKKVVTDAQYGWDAWVTDQERSIRDKANVARALILDNDLHTEQEAFCVSVMKPLTEMVRLGDSDSPNMGLVYAGMLKLFDTINESVQLRPDVELGGPFDYGRLEKIESIIGDRWKYLHCQYHSVGFLLNSAFQNVDLNSEKMSPYRDELMQDFEELCTRRLADVEKAAQALVDFQKYKDAAYFSP